MGNTRNSNTHHSVMLSPRVVTDPPVTLFDRLRSEYHRFWYEASQTLRWSRGRYRESSSGLPPDLQARQSKRIHTLVAAYQHRFEQTCPPATALQNYAYLDLLDRGRAALNWRVPTNIRVCDVGSANFAYAPALHLFFKPTQLTGVEVDGHRVYCNGRSRIDYAEGHIQDLPNTRYVVQDFRHYHKPADIITAWYPFVTPQPLLAWRLPLNLFDPGALFARVANNLAIGGQLVMINHGSSEAKVAQAILESVGLVCTGWYAHDIPLTKKTQTPILTLWHHT